MDKEEIIEGIIEGYRSLIKDRYQYEYLQQTYNIPESLTPLQIEELKSFFLDHIYPSYTQRQELNKAFDSLDGHIKSPSHMMKIILDSSSLLFKFGFKLPGILKAGIKALRSFRTASKFENLLVQAAVDKQLTPPYSKENIRSLMMTLPRQDIENFMEQGEQLFGILHNRKLVKNIIKIVTTLISTMKKRPGVYSVEEVNGFIIGKNIITQGNQLFENLNSEQQEVLLSKIVEIEKSEIRKIIDK